MANSATAVSYVVPIPGASTGNCRCGCSKSPAQPRPQFDVHLLSQFTTSIGHIADSATMVSKVLPITAASTARPSEKAPSWLQRFYL